MIEDELLRAKSRLSKLDDERALLSQHIAKLELQLSSKARIEAQSGSARELPLDGALIPTTSEEKVALFMERFRGRKDVYPKLWINVNKSTKGYSPACSNEWAPGLCDKRNVKCGECRNQAFMPVTEKTMIDHLQGRHVIGVYPMLADETCWFLAADFDKGAWRDDVSAFAETCLPHPRYPFRGRAFSIR